MKADNPGTNKSSRRAVKPKNASERWVIDDPSLMPPLYIVPLDGACLEPELLDGERVLVDKTAPIEPGDFAIIYWRPELVPPGKNQSMVKRVIAMPPPFITFPHRESPTSEAAFTVWLEQLNPPREYIIPCRDILAMHKCIVPMPDNVRGEKTPSQWPWRQA